MRRPSQKERKEHFTRTCSLKAKRWKVRIGHFEETTASRKKNQKDPPKDQMTPRRIREERFNTTYSAAAVFPDVLIRVRQSTSLGYTPWCELICDWGTL